MAGMFYSLKEAAERLNRTEDELRALAKQGRIREFRDGSELLFRVNEVDALIPETVNAEPAENADQESVEIPAFEDEPVQMEASEQEVQDQEVIELEAKIAEVPEPQVDQSQDAELESSVLEMINLDISELEEQDSSSDMDEIDAEIAQSPVSDMEMEQSAEPQPKAEPKKRHKPAPMPEVNIPQNLTAMQRFVNGLRDDNPVSVILLFVILCAVLSACGALGYFIYKLF